MQLTFLRGDHIIIDRSQLKLRDGFYALVLGDELVVRRVQIQLDGTSRIIADNDPGRPLDVPPGQIGQLRVVGRVVRDHRPIGNER